MLLSEHQEDMDNALPPPMHRPIYADGCTCLMCKKVCRTLNKLGKHMKKSHPVSEEDDDPGDQAEDAPKDTGEVEDTKQQEQVTSDQSELPDLVVNEPRGQPPQPPQPPSAAAGAPTPGTPEREKEKKGHKEASEKYKVVCEACNRYFQDAYTRSGHINAYHKEIIRQCGFCKSGFLLWSLNKVNTPLNVSGLNTESSLEDCNIQQ